MAVDPRIQALVESPLKGDFGQHRFALRKGGKGVARGYAATPGSGPAEETCGSCKHKVSVQDCAGTFHKCALANHRWTRGGASDIRVKSPTCSLWEKR